MKSEIASSLEKLIISKWYWAMLFLLGLMMEGTALYYQYALGDEPCQVCVHIRIWVAAFTLLALIMCALPRVQWLNSVGHALALGCMVGFYERSQFLYDVENFRGNGSCEFFLGFPEWFALDKWAPFIFEVRNLCGRTPEMIWGLTMAESLLAMAIGLVAVSGLALIFNVAALIRR